MENYVDGSITCPSTNFLITAPTLSVGSTTHYAATTAFRYSIGGKIYDKAAVTAGTTPQVVVLPATKYGLFVWEIGADGTIDAMTIAGNSTGYATYALAKAQMPTASAGHVIIGWCIVKADSGTWTGGTDDFTAGSDCEAAYFESATAVGAGYSVNVGFVPQCVEVWNHTCGTSMKWDTSLASGYGITDRFASSVVLSSARCAKGSTAENVANDQFDYYIGGIKYTKAAVAAGTAPSAIATKQSKWGVYAWEIGSDGTIDKLYGSTNADPGYDTEALAIAALPAANANHVVFMYATVQAKGTGDWTGATDDFTAGSDCAAANFYSVGVANPITSYGIYTLDDGVNRGFKIGYRPELWYPGDILYYKAWR